MVVHRSADIEEQQHLDGVVALRPHGEVQPAGVACGAVYGGVEVQFVGRALARELAQPTQGHLDVARSEFHAVVKVAVFALVPDLDCAAIARFLLAYAHALGVVAVGTEGRGAGRAYPFAAALMALLLFLETFFQCLHQFFPAAHGLDQGFFLGRQRELRLFQQPLERDLGGVTGGQFGTAEILAEGAVEFVEV